MYRVPFKGALLNPTSGKRDLLERVYIPKDHCHPNSFIVIGFRGSGLGFRVQGSNRCFGSQLRV